MILTGLDRNSAPRPLPELSKSVCNRPKSVWESAAGFPIMGYRQVTRYRHCSLTVSPMNRTFFSFTLPEVVIVCLLIIIFSGLFLMVPGH